MRPRKKTLSLEVLEARALFAGITDVADRYDRATDVLSAVNASDPFQSGLFINFPDRETSRLVLNGSGGGTITVDFGKLPDYVTIIEVKNFDTVKFTGEEDRIQSLTVSDVRLLQAPQIHVTNEFRSERVAQIELKSIDAPIDATSIKGDFVKVQVDDFGANTIVKLDVQTALIDTKSTDLILNVINQGSIVILPNVPQSLQASGLISPKNLQVANSDAAVLVSSGTLSPARPSDQLITLVPDDLVTAFLERLALSRTSSEAVDLASVKRMVAEIEQPLVLAALSSTGILDASFGLDPDVSKLLLKGDGTGSLVIDFDKLPSYVTSIEVRSFDTVTFQGADRLQKLSVHDVRSLQGPQIDVWSQFTSAGVDEISLKSINATGVFIQGDHVRLAVEDFGAFASLILNVNTVLIDTKSDDLNFLYFLNDSAIVALPSVPRLLTGADHMGDRLRLASSNVSIAVSNDTASPSTPSEQPITFVPEQIVATLLDRIALLRTSSDAVDVTLVRSIVAELTAPLQVQAGTAPIDATRLLPENALRRDTFATTVPIERSGSYEFTTPINTGAPVAVGSEQLGNQVLGDGNVPSMEQTVVETTVAPIETSIRLSPEVDSAAANVDVSVDPEAVPAAPKQSLLGMISQFVDQGMNLKSYLLDQLSQEVSPGERNGVLLVDPKPVRGAHQPRSLS